MFEDVDFSGIGKDEFMAFLERFTHEKCGNVYYCLSDLYFPEGLRIITKKLIIATSHGFGCVLLM